eukprot:COSAG05_NODE_7813_length_766_cov_0.913174_1_plen_81_part_10
MIAQTREPGGLPVEAQRPTSRIGPDPDLSPIFQKLTDASKFTGAAAVVAREASRRNTPKKPLPPMTTLEQEGIFKKLTDTK